MSSLSDLLLTSRPRFWPYLLGPLLVAMAWSPHSVLVFFEGGLPWLWLAFFAWPANLILYGVNDLADGDTDALNAKKSAYESRLDHGNRRSLILAIVLCVLAGGLLLIWSPNAFWAFSLWLFLALTYSLPPLRWKKRFLLDAYSNILYILPAVVVWQAFAPDSPLPLLALCAGGLWSVAMHTYSAIPDIEPDRNSGLRTTAVVLGKTRALWFVIAHWLLAAAIAWWMHPLLGAIATLYPGLGLYILHTKQDVFAWYRRFPRLNTLVGFGLFLWGLTVNFFYL